MRTTVLSLGPIPWLPGARPLPLDLEALEGLGDADILVINPEEIAGLWGRPESAVFSPRLRLPDDAPRIQRYLDQLKLEVRALLEAGGVLVFLLTRRRTCYLEQESGRFEMVSNYAWLGEAEPSNGLPGWPVENSSSQDLALSVTSRHPAMDYLQALQGEARYEVFIPASALKETPGLEVLASTRGGQPVSVAARFRRGHVIALPGPLEPIRQDSNGQPIVGPFPSPPMVAGKALLAACARLLEKHAPTPPPDWALDYVLPIEETLQASVQAAEQAVEKARMQLEHAHLQLRTARSFRDLLFQQGPMLERAVRRSLEMFGFEVMARAEDSQGYDAHVRADGWSALVQIEARDNGAISIETLSQLARVIDDHFHASSEGAQGILVGCAWRLRPPEARPEPFTRHTVEFARFKRFSLAPVDQLFLALQRLMTSSDPEGYRKLVRTRLLSPTEPVFRAPDVDAEA